MTDSADEGDELFSSRLGLILTTIGAAVADLIQPETVAIFMEAPGSLTFEVQDIPAIVAAVKPHPGVVTILDNTWATPLFFKPLSHGIDISIQAITKYIGGHADLMMGSITAEGKIFSQLRRTAHSLGLYVSPDDCFLALRGLRTLAPRLDRHQSTGFALARRMPTWRPWWTGWRCSALATPGVAMKA